MTSTRWLAVAGLAALVAASGCAKTETPLASGPTSAPASTSPPSTAAVSTADGSTTTSGGGHGGGIGAQIGRLTPEASSSFISKVGERTSAEDTGSFHLTMVVDDATDHPGHVDLMEIDGAYDHKTGASRATIDMSGLAAADPASLGGDAAMFREPIDIIEIGDEAYLQVPGLGADLGGWIKTSSDDGTSGVKPLLEMFKVDDIGRFLASLQAAGSVREIGTEDVAGVKTIHYHADVDPSKLDTSGATSGLLSNLGDAEEAAIDVWVDEDSLVHRVQIVADAGALGHDLATTFAGGQATLVLEMSDLGEPADITAPPEDEVLDLSGVDLGTAGSTGDPGGDDPLGLDEPSTVPASTPRVSKLPTTTEP